jgi:hypothetical protein
MENLNLLSALMNSQDLTKAEAFAELIEMKERMLEGEDPEEILYEYGLEPDYVFDLLD